MGIRLVVAAPQPGYASRLALYLKERDPQAEIAAFSQADALAHHLQAWRGADLLVVQQSLLHVVRQAAPGGAKVVVLTDDGTSGEHDGLPAIAQYQSLPRLAAEIRRMVGTASAKPAEGTELWTVYSAGGGAGKTTLALNIARQAAERGYSVMYLNLEALCGVGELLGGGEPEGREADGREPDGLSRLLYELSAHPSSAEARIRALGSRRSAINAGYLEPAEHPAELLAMTPERLEALIEALRRHGGFDLIVADPDGGFAGWQQRLLELSGRICWIASEDAQLLRKTETMLREWGERLPELLSKSTYVWNKSLGALPPDAPRPSGGGQWLSLPYIPQWKRVFDIGAILGAGAFAGGVDRLLDALGYTGPGERPALPGMTDYAQRAEGRRPGDGELREPVAAGGSYACSAPG
ncbi:hypothetical protein [Cohnella hashimotonis]|uniref:CobQ/CobB/MinD/ParA nucleotide binding domain-containing protein n=1 Tax=Cohnella hashimotonis TaxID=2826895 RepID=A0ABT6TK79_9BACL|nr:hypothetical protein [Cohnella hashimotonis]MDI4647253.1 hypothetical protein [Cohnella hashimotonis]